MGIDDTLRNLLLRKLSHFRATAPVYRIRQRNIEEIEKDAISFARTFVRSYSSVEPRTHMSRHNASTTLHLPEGSRLCVFHNSGAMIAKHNIGQTDKVIGGPVDKNNLINQTTDAMKRLELDRFVMQYEQLKFERLWLIKAQGMMKSGERISEVLCRAIGAFRRYLGDLPVWGRASIFVEVAGDNIVDSAGIDWRPIVDDPIDHAKVIDPESAVDSILGELGASRPGDTVTTKDYEPVMFSLGYFSLPKRKEQAFLQPVYVAMFNARGSTTLNRLVVIPAAHYPYESFSRIPEPHPKQPSRSDKPSYIINSDYTQPRAQ